MKSSGRHERLGRGYGWMWRANWNRPAAGERSPLKPRPSQHGSAHTGTRMSGWKGQTHGHQNQHALLPPEEGPVVAAAGSPTPPPLCWGDAETDGGPSETLAAKIGDHLEARRPQRDCGQKANVRTDGGRNAGRTPPHRRTAAAAHASAHRAWSRRVWSSRLGFLRYR